MYLCIHIFYDIDIVIMLAYSYYLHIHSLIHLELCFWPSNKVLNSLFFQLRFDLHQFLRQIFGSLASKCSTVSTS